VTSLFRLIVTCFCSLRT